MVLWFSSLGEVVVGGSECLRRKERGRDGSVRRWEIGGRADDVR